MEKTIDERAMDNFRPADRRSKAENSSGIEGYSFSNANLCLELFLSRNFLESLNRYNDDFS